MSRNNNSFMKNVHKLQCINNDCEKFLLPPFTTQPHRCRCWLLPAEEVNEVKSFCHIGGKLWKCILAIERVSNVYDSKRLMMMEYEFSRLLFQRFMLSFGNLTLTLREGKWSVHPTRQASWFMSLDKKCSFLHICAHRVLPLSLRFNIADLFPLRFRPEDECARRILTCEAQNYTVHDRSGDDGRRRNSRLGNHFSTVALTT